jgi:hypothetical protein
MLHLYLSQAYIRIVKAFAVGVSVSATAIFLMTRMQGVPARCWYGIF